MKEAGHADWSTRNQLQNTGQTFTHEGFESRITFCAVPDVGFAIRFYSELS
jgi:hypothetical protein